MFLLFKDILGIKSHTYQTFLFADAESNLPAHVSVLVQVLRNLAVAAQLCVCVLSCSNNFLQHYLFLQFLIHPLQLACLQVNKAQTEHPFAERRMCVCALK